MKAVRIFAMLLAGCLWTSAAHAQDEFYTLGKKDSTQSYYQLSISDLYNLNVTTASNASEKLKKAPATIIVINEDEIRERGYMEVYDVLSDLPGFDLSRAFGDDHYYLYARGYRKTLSDQMLFMMDGIIMNHLYNNNMDAFLQYPLYGIKQIEIVYGPASAVYGANAFAGVINFITRNEGKTSIFLSKGAANTQTIELNLSKQLGELTVNVQGRLHATSGHDFTNRHAFLTDTIYSSPYIWGPFMQTEFAGYNSPGMGRYMHASVNYKELTAGVITWFNESGLGTEFPADRALPGGRWQFDEQTAYAKYERGFGGLRSKTLLVGRQSGNPESSLFIARWDSGSKYASYWSTTNKAFSLFQDFSYSFSNVLSANFGVKYLYRILQRDYDIVDGPNLPNSWVGAYPFSEMPLPYRRIDGQTNHGRLEDQGVYAQLRYSPSKVVDLIGGMRLDHNSLWGPVWSPRMGIVIEPTSQIVAKVFYGTAFLEPSSRVLYGGWQGTLSNPDLVPERMRTLEASVSYTQKNYALGANLYVNNGVDVISQIGGEPVNIGSNRTIGFDAFAKAIYRPGLGALNRLKIDAYLSYMKAQEAATDTSAFVVTPNIAPLKFRLIGTATFGNKLDISLIGRYVSAIETVPTNPIRQIDPFLVWDSNVLLRNFPFKSMSMGLKVYNLLNANYWHPGYRDASAGETLYDSDGRRLNSGGWYSSRLPQPFRSAHLTMRIDF